MGANVVEMLNYKGKIVYIWRIIQRNLAKERTREAKLMKTQNQKRLVEFTENPGGKQIGPAV